MTKILTRSLMRAPSLGGSKRKGYVKAGVHSFRVIHEPQLTRVNDSVDLIGI